MSIFTLLPMLCICEKPEWRLPLTLTGVRDEANSGMTIHTLVLTVDSFSCNCSSMNSSLSIDFKNISHLAQAIVACV